jgi:large subunit ribosomal protein L4
MATRSTDLQPRSYDYPFPRKKLLGALRSALASKLADGKLTVVDSLEIKEGKTKLYREALNKLDVDAHGAAGGERQDADAVAGAGRAQPEGRGVGAEQRSAPLTTCCAMSMAIFSKPAIEQLAERW